MQPSLTAIIDSSVINYNTQTDDSKRLSVA